MTDQPAPYKEAFCYDPDTKVYSGTTTADLGEAEWRLNGQAVYHVPAWATLKPVQNVPDGFQAVWDVQSGTWVNEPIPTPVVEEVDPQANAGVVVNNNQISVLDFMDRFTEPEQIALVTAAMQSPAVKLWYDRMLAASYVDLTDARTIAGMVAITNAGLITEDRRGKIMEIV